MLEESENDESEERDNCLPIAKPPELHSRKESFTRVVVSEESRCSEEDPNRYAACSNLTKLITQLGKDSSNKNIDFF